MVDHRIHSADFWVVCVCLCMSLCVCLLGFLCCTIESRNWLLLLMKPPLAKRLIDIGELIVDEIAEFSRGTQPVYGVNVGGQCGIDATVNYGA